MPRSFFAINKTGLLLRCQMKCFCHFKYTNCPTVMLADSIKYYNYIPSHILYWDPYNTGKQKPGIRLVLIEGLYRKTPQLEKSEPKQTTNIQHSTKFKVQSTAPTIEGNIVFTFCQVRRWLQPSSTGTGATPR
jgi:hypothetical protein